MNKRLPWHASACMPPACKEHVPWGFSLGCPAMDLFGAVVYLDEVSPPMVVLLAIMVVAYFMRVRTLSEDPRRRVSRWRQFSFVCSIVVLVGEPISPLGPWSDESFTAHMSEHLLIGDIAALLMVLGLTGPLIQPLLRNPVIQLIRPLAEPIPAFVLWTLNLYFWHLPFAMDGAINNDYVHVLQHMCFFGAGFNVWMALFGPLPTPEWFGNIAKLIYIVLLRASSTVLGNFFIFSDRVYYDNYTSAVNPFGLSPTGDQITAGSVMMGEGSLVAFLLAGYLFFRAAREGEESQQLMEVAARHGTAITQQRAERAAHAGTTERLRESITGAATEDAAEKLDRQHEADLS